MWGPNLDNQTTVLQAITRNSGASRTNTVVGMGSHGQGDSCPMRGMPPRCLLRLIEGQKDERPKSGLHGITFLGANLSLNLFFLGGQARQDPPCRTPDPPCMQGSGAEARARPPEGSRSALKRCGRVERKGEFQWGPWKQRASRAGADFLPQLQANGADPNKRVRLQRVIATAQGYPARLLVRAGSWLGRPRVQVRAIKPRGCSGG